MHYRLYIEATTPIKVKKRKWVASTLEVEDPCLSLGSLPHPGWEEEISGKRTRAKKVTKTFPTGGASMGCYFAGIGLHVGEAMTEGPRHTKKKKKSGSKRKIVTNIPGLESSLLNCHRCTPWRRFRSF